jgi:transcriptional regulator with XRE-family HTH domain
MKAEDLKRKREKLKMTQAELAKRLDVKPLTVLRWENGQVPIPKMAELALKEIERQESG